MAYLLGIDVGTSSLKALLIDESGETKAISAEEYTFSTPRPLWAETDPEVWWQAFLKVAPKLLEIAKVTGGEIAAIGLSGQMHGLVLLDAEGRVLRPCIMWNDQRCSAQCADITKRVGEAKAHALTGKPILPSFTAGKILWVRDNESEIYSKTAKALLPKDYFRYRLSGEFFSEVSDASGTCLLDVSKRQWSEELLDACDIPRGWLPEVTESTVVSTRLSSEVSGLTGLLEGTPIVGGAGDQAAGAVGTGMVNEGDISVTLGTSGVVFAASEVCRLDPERKLHSYCHAVPGKWHLMGVVLSAAGSFQWYRDALCGEEIAIEKETGRDAYDLLTEAASGVAAGSEGLLFLPYLTGERTPHPDPHARGVFFGLTRRHGKAHMTRALLEGVTYALRDSLELMRSLGIESDQVAASGGGSKSAFWRQMMADVFELKISTLNATEGAAFGAALLAGVGAGIFPTVEEACAQCIRTTGETTPGPDARIYSDFYPRFRSLYPALKNEFEELSKVVEKHFKEP